MNYKEEELAPDWWNKNTITGYTMFDRTRKRKGKKVKLTNPFDINFEQ